MSLLILSCGQKQDSPKAYTIEKVSSDDYVEIYKTNLGHIIRDTIGKGPSNERVDITDSKGNPLAVAGKASECEYYEFVKYLYNDQGKLTGFIRFPFNEAEQNNYDANDGDIAFSQQFDTNAFIPESLSDETTMAKYQTERILKFQTRFTSTS